MSKIRQSLSINLSLLTLSTALTLLGAEILVRLIAPQPALLFAEGLYISDQATGYRHQSGYRGFLTNVVEYKTRLDINKHGLRGPEIGKRGIRLIVLGDSFIFGQGVEAEETFAAHLQTLLSKKGHNIEVHNAGVRGYGTIQEAAWLRRYGLALAPEVVVVGIFLGNDLHDNMTSPADRLRNFSPPRAWHTPVTKRLYAHSHLYRMMRELLQRYLLNARQSEVEWLRRTYGSANNGYSHQALAITATALDLLGELTRQKGATFIAMLIPDRVQVEASPRAVFEEFSRNHPYLELNVQYPNEIFSEMLSARRIRYIDLTSGFQKEVSRNNTLYLPIDGHWNKAGHQLAANLVAPLFDDILRLRPAIAQAGGLRPDVQVAR